MAALFLVEPLCGCSCIEQHNYMGLYFVDKCTVFCYVLLPYVAVCLAYAVLHKLKAFFEG